MASPGRTAASPTRHMEDDGDDDGPNDVSRPLTHSHDPGGGKASEALRRTESSRRRSMPAGLEVTSPTHSPMGAGRGFESPTKARGLVPEPVVEDISSVTIKARRVTIHSLGLKPSENDAGSGNVTLKLRRMSTSFGPEAAADFTQLSLSASSADRREEFIFTEPVVREPSTGPTAVCPPAPAGEEREVFYLENEWTFWYDETVGRKHAPTELGSFNTVQGFWSYWNNVDITVLRDHCNLSLFKRGIPPAREDPMNRDGGRWVVSDVPKGQRVRYWSKVVMMMIGEQLDDDSDNLVCGAMFVPRESGDTMQLWVDGGHAVRLRGRETVKPKLGQARQPMPEILHSLFPASGIVLRWSYVPASEPLHDDPRRPGSKPEGSRYRKEPHSASGSQSGSFRMRKELSMSMDEPRGPTTPTDGPHSSHAQFPPFANLLSASTDAFAILSPDCLSPGMPLSRESTTLDMSGSGGGGGGGGGPTEGDPAGLQGKLEDALHTMNTTLDTQRRVLQQRVVQISCLLSLFEQIQHNPVEMGNQRLADLIQAHVAQSYTSI